MLNAINFASDETGSTECVAFGLVRGNQHERCKREFYVVVMYLCVDGLFKL